MDAKAQDAQWWSFLGPIIVKYGIIIIATSALDGPGFYLASIGTTVGIDLIYQGAENARNIARDNAMFAGSLQWLVGRYSTATIQLSHNTVNGLNLIRGSTLPQPPELTVTIQGMRSYGHYRMWPGLFWAEDRAELALSVRNNATYSTTVLTSVDYLHKDFWKGDRRIYLEGTALDLDEYKSGTAYVPLKLPAGGESPDLLDSIDILVLGGTDTGLYPSARFGVNWIPERVETSAHAALLPVGYTEVDAEAAPTLPYPLASSVTALPGTPQYVLVVTVQNPFTLTAKADVSQLLPGEFTVVDAGGAAWNGSALTWSFTLAPKSVVQLAAVLNWNGAPGASTLLTGAQLSFAGLNGEGGDSYAAEAHTVHAGWPITASVAAPERWHINSTANLTVTLANHLQGIALDGLLRLSLVTPAGTVLVNAEQPVSITQGATKTMALPIAVPDYVGYVQFMTELTLGSETRLIVSDTVLLEGYRALLPFVRR